MEKSSLSPPGERLRRRRIIITTSIAFWLRFCISFAICFIFVEGLGNMKKIGIDRGWEILRSTIYTDTCDLGSSSDDGLDNKVILEDNQIGERERRRSSYDGCGEETWDRKVMFKNQFVSDNAYRASL
ncbi:Uncharacterized protein Rs2_34101 [Raphanus sativus]|nr:Uncharacterized protein Rs2_34101 [Raphanus sativus]